MQTWEYTRITLTPEAMDFRSPGSIIEGELNEQGNKGWELVQLIVLPTTSMAVFKRAVEIMREKVL